MNWRIWKADIAKIIIAVIYFSKRSIVDIWQGSEYVSGSEYPKVLNMPLVLNVPEFWIYQGSEYASVLNMPGFWICQAYTGSRICLNNTWIWLNMPDYVWIYLNMSVYTKICVSMPKSAWIDFALYFPISPFVLQSLFYLNTWLLIWT